MRWPWRKEPTESQILDSLDLWEHGSLYTVLCGLRGPDRGGVEDLSFPANIIAKNLTVALRRELGFKQEYWRDTIASSILNAWNAMPRHWQLHLMGAYKALEYLRPGATARMKIDLKSCVGIEMLPWGGRGDRGEGSMTSDDEVVAVVDWFIKHNVPSISPATSLHLLEIEEILQDEIKKYPETPKAIQAYAIALHIVAKAGHIQQGVVIAQLERAVRKSGDET